MNEDELIVEPVIIEGNHGEVDILEILDVDGGVVEHIHAREIVEVEVGDVLVVDQQLFVSLEIEHLGAVECIGSHGVHLIGKHRVDADIATVLEVNTQEVLGVGLFGNLPTDLEQ